MLYIAAIQLLKTEPKYDSCGKRKVTNRNLSINLNSEGSKRARIHFHSFYDETHEIEIVVDRYDCDSA